MGWSVSTQYIELMNACSVEPKGTLHGDVGFGSGKSTAFVAPVAFGPARPRASSDFYRLLKNLLFFIDSYALAKCMPDWRGIGLHFI
jgi:hypothetical protein